MSEFALSTVKSIRERLGECVNEIEKIERNIKESPSEVIGKTELTKETLQALPWRPFESRRGAWIFRDLKHPAARMLADVLAKNGGGIELHGVHYKYSGQNGKFISRFGGQRM